MCNSTFHTNLTQQTTACKSVIQPKPYWYILDLTIHYLNMPVHSAMLRNKITTVKLNNYFISTVYINIC